MGAYDDNEVVISGIGGHFPGCDNMEELEAKLLAGVDMVTEDNPRWEPGEFNVPIRCGQMKTLYKCDSQFFGLALKQCQALDPITRMVLESSYEAIFDAGLHPSDLAGSKTGVFFGTSILETEMSQMDSKASDAYNILGRNKTMNANRISYFLDLKGPSLAIDSSWSSGLQVLALGYDYIRSGLCDCAIIAAGSSIIHSEFSKHFSDLNMLSPDGVSRPFDENANGYVRGEAVTVMILQKLKNAKRNYGTIVNAVAVTMSIRTDQILLPNRHNWLELYKRFYGECNVDPKDVTFLEADGLACQDADEEELNAVCDFFCRERDPSNPLLIGSVKSNVGHVLAAAGLCSLAKVLITNHTGTIPPNLNYSAPNKRITGLLNGKLKVVTEATAFDGDLLAVNSFGFGGTYGHCLIKRPNTGERQLIETTTEQVPRLVLASARNEEEMDRVLNKIEELDPHDDCIPLIGDIFSRNIANHLSRGYTVLPKKAGLRGNEPFQGEKRPVWFIFSGMGSHWPTMGRDMVNLPMYKQSIDKCHNILKKKGIDLWHILTTDDNTIFDNIINSFVGISSIQIALVDILYAIGIRPDGIIGHSAGELGAAYADGSLTLEETIMSSYSRGKVSVEAKVIKGMMAAVGKGWTEMKNLLPEDIDIACHNSSTNCTISGPTDSVISYADKLKAEGVFVKVVNASNIAFHSKHIQQLGPKLMEELLPVIVTPRERSSKWISSSVPESRWNEPEWKVCSAEYLTNNLLSPVYFEEACMHIPKNAIVIEIAPHSLLLSILKRSLHSSCINIGLTHRNAANQLLYVLQAIGKLYTIGLQPQIGALYPKTELPVPLKTPFLGAFASWDHSYTWRTLSKTNKVLNKSCRQYILYLDEMPYYKGLKIFNKMVLPCSVFFSVVLDVYSSAKNIKPSQARVTFEDVVFRKRVDIEKKRNVSLLVTILEGSGKFEILRDDDVIVFGVVKESNINDSEWNNPKYVQQVKADAPLMDSNVLYSELSHSGYEYNEALRGIKSMYTDGNSWESCIEWKGELVVLLESLIQTQLLSLNDPQNLRELKVIGELSLDPNLLNEGEIGVNLNGKTGVIHGKGIYLKRMKFNIVKRECALLAKNNKMEYFFTPKPNSSLVLSFAEYFAGNVKWEGAGYSGSDSSGGNVMGLASADLVTSSLQPDPILCWKVPNTWKLDQSATVPIPYTLAYYIMKIMTDIKERDSVLVTNGASSIGMACITVALQYTKEVFATVSSRQEEQIFVNKFRQLKGNVINTDPERDNAVLLHNMVTRTRKQGVTYLISTCPGTKLDKYINCITNHSHFFQIFTEETEEGFQLTRVDNLLKSASIYGVRIKNILSCHESDKMAMRDFVDEAIKSDVITPFSANIISHEKLHENCQRTVYKESEIVRLGTSESMPRFMCSSESTYMVISGRVNIGLLAAEWFAKRHAENIVLIHSDKSISSNSAAKINHLRQNTSLIVKYVDSFDKRCLESCKHGSVANVDAALVFPTDEDQHKDSSYNVITFLESKCLKPKGHLVCFLKSDSRALDLCVERSRSGKPTLAVVSDTKSNGKWQEFIDNMDTFLKGNEEGIIQLEDENNEEIIREKDIDEFLNTLPKNMDEIADYGENLPNDVKVTEIRTLSSPLHDVREIVPIFLIGGIGKCQKLVDRFRVSFYPVYIVELPHLGRATIEELASYAIPKIKSITEGPYIITGEQWGGCVALELGRQLENLGHEAHVFLLSGTPLEVVEPLRFVASMGEPLEVSLLSRMLQIKDQEILQEVSNQENWKRKLDYCMQYIKEQYRHNVRKGLDAIKYRLEALINYSMKNPLNGPLTVITKREISSEHYKHLCTKRVQVCEVKQEQDTLNDEIFNMIHETAIYKVIKN